MKRIISIILSVALLLGMNITVFSQENLPTVGQKTNGFTVVDRSYQKLVNAESILFEHDKTGASVMYIASDDIERSFDISFKTPALDNTGTPHVFEHICISGSEKYPSQNLFFPILSQTYNTFVNAMTGNNYTTYPLASLSEKQLLLLSDYYLDGVFNPMLYTEEKLYRREAWRYELDDLDSALTLTGTVYNEMRGNEQIETAAYYNMLEGLFPNSIISNNSGGNPEYIPDLTYQSLLDFHQQYYHPSNALVILYGDLDYNAFLKQLDGYFSKYDKRDIKVENGAINPLNSTSDKVYKFPVESTSDINKASVVDYAFAANGASTMDKFGLSVLSSILSHDSSPLVQNILQRYGTANMKIDCLMNFPTAVVDFTVTNVDGDDKEGIKTVIENSLKQISARGFDNSAVDAILSNIQFSNYMLAEQNSLGINYSAVLASMWATNGNLDYFNDYIDAIEMMKKEKDNGYFENLIDKYLLNNSHKTIIATVPESGLFEQKALELEQNLAEVKASMTEEELIQIIDFSQKLEKWSSEEPPKELIERLTPITVSELPEEIKKYDVKQSRSNGTDVYTSEADIGDIGMTAVCLNADGIEVDDLHYLQLYSSLLGVLETKSYSSYELSMLTTQYLNNFYVNVDTFNQEDNNFEPVLTFNWYGLTEDYAKSIELMRGIMFETEFENITTIKSVIGGIKNSMRTQINSMPYAYMMPRAVATQDNSANYYSYITGFEYYKFLCEAEQIILENPREIIEKLEHINSKLVNKNNSKVMFAGNQKSINVFNNEIGKLFDGIQDKEVTKVDYSVIEKPSTSEAFVIDSSVQYNLLYASLESMGITYSGKLKPLEMYIYDSFLTPRIRHGIGAYDNITMFDKIGIMFISFRDPGINATYDVYKELGDFMASSNLSQEDVDRYIVKTYSSYALPSPELTGALSAISAFIAGKDSATEKQRVMQEMKSLTPSDLRSASQPFYDMYEFGVKSTAGGASIINQNIDRFNNIIYIDSQEYINDEIKVMINGEYIAFAEVPFLSNSRTFVPLRAIFEALGAEVVWYEDTETIVAYRDDTIVVLKIGSDVIYINGESVVIDAPAMLVGERTFVPLRAVAESFGAEVEWDDETQTVIITDFISLFESLLNEAA